MAILKLVAILSLSLGLINLFPIPVLDGGHIMLFIIEKIRNKCVSNKTEGILNRIGVAILATLMVFVFYQDIKRGRNILETRVRLVQIVRVKQKNKKVCD